MCFTALGLFLVQIKLCRDSDFADALVLSGFVAVLLHIGFTGLIINLSWLPAFCVAHATFATILLLSGLCIRHFMLRGGRSATPEAQVTFDRRACITQLTLLLGLSLLAYSLQSISRTHTPEFVPWDAMMNWLPPSLWNLAIGEPVSLVATSDWLESGSQTNYTLGNERAIYYPHAVRWIVVFENQISAMTEQPLSVADVTFDFWPFFYVLTVIALSAGVHLATHSLTSTFFAGFFVATTPFLLMHSIFPGYADFFLGSLIVMGALLMVTPNESKFYLCIGLFILGAAVFVKKPGALLSFATLASVLALSFGGQLFRGIIQERYRSALLWLLLLMLLGGVALFLYWPRSAFPALFGDAAPPIGRLAAAFWMNTIANNTWGALFVLFFLANLARLRGLVNGNRVAVKFAHDLMNLGCSLIALTTIGMLVFIPWSVVDGTTLNRALMSGALLLGVGSAARVGLAISSHNSRGAHALRHT